MLPATPRTDQPNLFYGSLVDMPDMNDPLIVSGDTIDRGVFEKKFVPLYSKEGRPARPIRPMVGLLLLKRLEDFSRNCFKGFIGDEFDLLLAATA